MSSAPISKSTSTLVRIWSGFAVFVGATGPALFSDDVACDVRGVYREILGDQVEDARAIAEVLDRFRGSLADADDEPVVVLALAVTASKLGRLTPELRGRAIALLDAGRGLERRADDARLLKHRQRALGKARH